MQLYIVVSDFFFHFCCIVDVVVVEMVYCVSFLENSKMIIIIKIACGWSRVDWLFVGTWSV